MTPLAPHRLRPLAALALLAAERAALACEAPAPLFAAGHEAGAVCPDDAAARGLTMFDLADDGVPLILIDLQRVAQDGTRVRASAGAGSFRKGESLGALMAQAKAHLEEVTRAANDPAVSARRAAAVKRVAETKRKSEDATGLDHRR